MTEPVSGLLVSFYTAIKGAALLLIVGAFVLMAWIIVVALRVPTSNREWVVSLFSTLSVSIGGGASFIGYFQLYTLMTDTQHHYIGIIICGFIFFLFGLVGWAVVRMVFNFIEVSDDKDIFQVAKHIVVAVKDIKNAESSDLGVQKADKRLDKDEDG